MAKDSLSNKNSPSENYSENEISSHSVDDNDMEKESKGKKINSAKDTYEAYQAKYEERDNQI